ncbi:predicted MFS family arabinose efflux permease [Jatrophihabitans sp. GAS493]|uniref:MFS transporter n=1 Tax=Jatrophihabitans sp. GAS493 TaxID=1907575 RepID=UPI000BC05D80|nr:MFS transporter [Jatrophihabitans sp. GAS493]SOD71306.1 predicted MFS family arabinose efflux permease [Jatrophihabitans sp. GAS493]
MTEDLDRQRAELDPVGDPAARGLHPAWIVAAVGFLSLLLAAGFRATPGVLLVPLQNEFGWSRAAIGGAVSVNLVLYGLAGPFAAALTQRFGLRRVVPSAMALIAAGSALTVTMTQLWQLYLCWGVMVGVGTGAVAPVLAATIANRWFHERRGLVLGVLTAGSATGQLLFLPLLAALSQDGDWRRAAWAVAGAALLVVPISALFLREYPVDLGRAPYGGSSIEARPVITARPIATAFSVLRRAARTRQFWILCGTFFVCGASTNGLIATHFIPAAMDHDMPETTAAGMLAAMGILDVVGTSASGWLTDRYDPRKLLFAYYALRGLSLLALPRALVAQHLSLGAFVAFYGLDWIATVPPTVALVNQTFGRQEGIVVWGWIFAAHQLGAAIAAFSAGWIRDASGSYGPAFVGAGTLCLLAAAAVFTIRGSAVDRFRERGEPPALDGTGGSLLTAGSAS